MLRNARTAVKFFTYGMIIGLLFAPQSGEQTRKQLFGMLGGTIEEAVSNLTGGGSASGTSSQG
ncbi:MAG TPA: YtxH domain-containing protein [Thermomicrobiales bacterium]|nr:YtxH domain-containing protein [Thermomicrobiales bacterium]